MVSAQNFVRIQQRCVEVLEHKLSVFRCTRPIHDALGLIARIVEFVNTQRRSHSAPDGLVLLRVYIPCERYDQSESRLLRCMLMGGVNCTRVAVKHAPIVPQVVVSVVGVKAKHRSEADIGAATVITVTAHESSLVFSL